MLKAVIHLSYADFLQHRSKTHSVPFFLSLWEIMTNARLTQLMKDKTSSLRKIYHSLNLHFYLLKGSPNFPSKFSRNWRSVTNLSKVLFFRTHLKTRERQYRVTLKKCDDFNFLFFKVKDMDNSKIFFQPRTIWTRVSKSTKRVLRSFWSWTFCKRWK